MIITSEQFAAAYAKVPYPIRAFLVSDELGEIVKKIGITYGLHVDVVDALYRETSNMLLGLINPQQFIAELTALGIDAGTSNSITGELGQKIFMPLHEQVLKAGAVQPDEEDDETMYAELAKTIIVERAPSALLIPQIPSSPRPIPPSTPSIPLQPRAVDTVSNVPAPKYEVPQEPLMSRPVLVQKLNSVQMPLARTMERDIQETKAPHIPEPQQISPIANPFTPHPIETPAPTTPILVQAPSIPQPEPESYMAAATPAATSIQMPEPVTPEAASVPPIIIPMPSPVTPTGAPISMPIQPRTASSQSSTTGPTENRDALHAVLKEYGIDPYREPAS